MGKKQIHILKIIIFIWTLGMIGRNAMAQSSMAILDSVSVDPSSGFVYVGWHAAYPDSVTYYRVNRKNIEDSDPNHPASDSLDVIEYGEPLLYVDTTVNAGEKTYSYRIDGVNGIYTAYHETILLTGEYDSCNAAINLTWTEYKGWQIVQEYRVMDFNTRKIIGKTSDNYFEVNGIKQDSIYQFYIMAIGSFGVTSSSNRVVLYTDRPNLPGFIIPGDVLVSENGVKASFIIDPQSELRNYHLLRLEINHDTDGELISNFNGQDVELVNFEDNEISPFESIYKYQLIAIDGCENEVFRSDMLRTMILKIDNDSESVLLNWTNGDIWPGETEYIVSRQNPQKSYDEIIRTENLSFADVISQLKGHGFSNRLCYILEAANDQSGHKMSISPVCIDIEPEVFIPEVFYPSRSENNIFLPQFSFIPSQYHIQILNRAGFVVFQSDNPNEGWTGGSSPSSTYMYKITLQKPGEEKRNIIGHVSIIRK